VQVLVATPTRVDVTLEIGRVDESVSVTGNAETVNTQDASLGISCRSGVRLRSCPLLRVTRSTCSRCNRALFSPARPTLTCSRWVPRKDLDPREGVVNGVLGNQSYVSLDGIESNDFQNQSAFTSALPVTLDALQEFRVITTNATASSGAAGGAQVEMVTKSGTNSFHGNLRWFNRDTVLAANSFFNNMEGVGRAKLIRNIFGGSLGGPVLPALKDRVFFFVDYEGRLDRSATPVTRVIPTQQPEGGKFVLHGCGEWPRSNSLPQQRRHLLRGIDPDASGAA
jgi:hypothetical protein